ncbi:hypothetical protein A3H53_02140 [Candidatus Nomurabacteria bacterium RIFCSPLOWO2_02_FULL_40_10]|uniref:Uncharacterized protein n=1 Tax=Candidatus Nomurabacteria bacterium RIFCSPLOWO2_02_FULL_40_10 TaxID=1801786 RepID=A0A1F6XWD8_9BACT|nr:MAG: hypothetical protein A3H53_02140 [Candidatus Nomurabacteria bacterium RIFCSPLOWO2_02_FULL_40_10]
METTGAETPGSNPSQVIQSQQENEVNADIADWVMRHAIEKSLENEKLKRQFLTYKKYKKIENLKETPPDVEEIVYDIYGLNGKPMERIVSEDGKSVKKQGKQSEMDFTDSLATRYLPRMNFHKTGEIIKNDRAYYIIRYEPRTTPDKLPANDRYDEGINRSSGQIYVDMETFQIWKLTAEITKKFSKAAGVFRLDNFMLEMEQEEKFGIMVPKRMTMTIDYTVLGIFRTYQRNTQTYGEHVDKRMQP